MARKGNESAIFKLVVVIGAAAAVYGLVIARSRLMGEGPTPSASGSTAPSASASASALAAPSVSVASSANADAASAPTEADGVALREAVAAGDLPKVQELARKGVPLAGSLGPASASGSLPLVTWLLDRGVDPHEDEGATVPPVLLADAHEGVVAFLLAHGAKEPSLAASIRAGATNAVGRALAKNKAAATLRTADSEMPLGELPLQIAVASNTGAKRLAIAKQLLDAGAVLDVETLIASAAGTTKADAEALVEVYLAHKIAPDAAYLMIMNERDPKMIARVAAKGVAWTSENPALPPTPPLVSAARELDVPRVRALLVAGAPVDRAGEGDETALFATIDASPPDSQDAAAIVGALLAKGANPNKRTAGGRRPLHAAAEKGEEAIVRALLAKDAHVDDEVGGVTALEAAEANGHQGIAKLLLARGAKKKKKAPADGTP